MEIIENNKHVLTTFNNVGLGLTFKCGDDYFMKIEFVSNMMPKIGKFGAITVDTYNAVRLNDGKLHEFKSDEEVVLVNCKLVVE
jgi:hypothetical protein